MSKVFVLFFLLPLNLLAQDVGLKLDLGASYMTGSSGDYAHMDLLKKAGPSAKFGMFFDFRMTRRSSLSFEIDYVKMESKEVLNGVILMDKYGRLVAYGNQYIRKKVTCLAMPVYYSFHFNSLSVNAGFQLSTVMSGSAELRSESEFYEYGSRWDLPLNEVDYGPRFGLQWQLGKRLSMQATYYHGISNIRQGASDDAADFWAIRQLSFGAKYAFIKELKRYEK